MTDTSANPVRGGYGELGARLLATAILGRKEQAATAAAEAKQKAAWDQVTPLFGGYQDGPPVNLQPPPPAAAPPPVTDPSAAIGQATQAMAPGPPPPEQAPYTYQAPEKTGSIPLDDPKWGQAVASLQQAGIDPSHLLEWAKAAQPDIQFAPNGQAVNKHDSRAVGQVFPNRVAVNDQVVDLNDPNNTNRAVPEAPVKGANPVYDNRGNVVDWSLPPGATGAVERAAQAQSHGAAKGSAPYDFINVPTATGAPATVSKEQAAGGAFTGQAPSDAAYGADIARNAATQYQGIQTAGQHAPELIAKYQQLGHLLAGVDGGTLTPVGKEIASYANSLGVKLDPNLPNKEAAMALTNQLALSLRDPSSGGGMPGALSNSDRDFLVKSVPNLAQTSQGRAVMVQSQIRLLQRQQEVAEKARQWQHRFGRIDAMDAHGKGFQDYLGAWAATHPLFGQ